MKAVIFDVDGTLINSVDFHAQAWKRAFEHFGHGISVEQIGPQIGKGGDQLMPVFLSKSEVESHGKNIEKYRSELFKNDYLGAVKAFPKVRELFQRLLSDGWKVGLASSSKQDELKIYKTICRIDDLLDAETSSDDAEKSKPYPDIFQAAVHRLKVLPRDCIVVGDSPYDAEAAGQAGIMAIGFLCGGFPPGDLTAAGFLKLYPGPADLLNHYDRSVFHEKRPHRS